MAENIPDYLKEPDFNIDEYIDSLVALGVPKDEIWDHTLNEENLAIYKRIFVRGKVDLEILEGQEGIKPSRFYFAPFFSTNAAATRTSTGTFLVRMNIGYVHTVVEICKHAESVVQTHDDLKYYAVEPEYARRSLSGYMLDQISDFTFYHERAHLIQNRDLDDFLCQDSSTGEENVLWDASRHVKEWDADLAAVRQIYYRTLVDYELLEPGKQNKDALFRLICVSISGILLYFFRTHDNYPIYYAERTHPHPMVRIYYIMHHFMVLLSWKRPFGFQYDLQSFHNEVYKFSRLVAGLNTYKMTQFFQVHDADIELYIERLEATAKKYPSLYLWHIKKGKNDANNAEQHPKIAG
jgi:hypothetical protein